MTWTRISDEWPDRPDVLSVSRSARLLHVEATVWCNRKLTDGKVPRAALPRLTDSDDLEGDIADLERAGLWTALDLTTWQLDWSDQERAEDVKARQEYRADVQKRYRERKQKHRIGDHSACDPRNCKPRRLHDADNHGECTPRHCRSVTGNTTGHVSSGVTTSRPVPSRPAPKGQGTGSRSRCPSGAPVAADGSCCADCGSSHGHPAAATSLQEVS